MADEREGVHKATDGRARLPAPVGLVGTHGVFFSFLALSLSLSAVVCKTKQTPVESVMGNETQAMQVATYASQCNDEMWLCGDKWLQKSTYAD